MKKVSEYLEHAAECRKMATRALPEHREMLLHMADTWEMLARDRERKMGDETQDKKKHQGPSRHTLDIISLSVEP